MRLQSFNRGKGKGGFFPCGVAITVPCFKFYQILLLLSTDKKSLDYKRYALEQ